MRLLILAAQYFPVIGGSEVQTRLLAREFKRQGHEVEVWTRRLEGRDAATETVDGVIVRRLGLTVASRAPWMRRVERLDFAFRLYREIRSRADRFDLIFVNQLQYPALIATMARRGLAVPVVARSAASGPQSEMNRKDLFSRFQKRGLVRDLDCVVTLGPVTRDECLAAGFSLSRIAVIPNGIEVLSAPRRARAPVPPLGVVWVGKLRKEKRADLAIRAWREAAIPGELTLVGDGDDRRAIEALIASDRSPVSPKITLKGLLENPRDELAAAHVYLQSSDTEGMSNALLEAMSQGCACVATDVGETRLVLGGSRSGDIAAGSFVRAEGGLLVRPGDLRGVALAMRALLDPALREALGKAAEARGHADHNISRVARRYEDLFQALRGQGRAVSAA